MLARPAINKLYMPLRSGAPQSYTQNFTRSFVLMVYSLANMCVFVKKSALFTTNRPSFMINLQATASAAPLNTKLVFHHPLIRTLPPKRDVKLNTQNNKLDGPCYILHCQAISRG